MTTAIPLQQRLDILTTELHQLGLALIRLEQDAKFAELCGRNSRASMLWMRRDLTRAHRSQIIRELFFERQLEFSQPWRTWL